MLGVPKSDALADRILAWPPAIGHPLVDDDDSGSVAVVLFSDAPAAQDRDAHGAKIAGEHHPIRRARRLTRARDGTAFDVKVIAPQIAGERQVIDRAG